MADEQVNNVKNNVIPARNGGYLNPGGTLGNKGGTGRPPNELRALARQGLGPGIEFATTVATDNDREDKIRLDAVKLLKDIGIPSQVETVSVTVEADQVLTDLCCALAEVVLERGLPEDLIDDVMSRYSAKTDKKSAES
jgi:hypothetical protein